MTQPLFAPAPPLPLFLVINDWSLLNRLNYYHRSAELACSLTIPTTAQLLPKVDYNDYQFIQEYDVYLMGKSMFDCKEFERAAFFLENCKSNKGFFLHMYAKFLVSLLICNRVILKSLLLKTKMFLKHSQSGCNNFKTSCKSTDLNC